MEEIMAIHEVCVDYNKEIVKEWMSAD